MATYELTEFGDVPILQGNAVPVAPLPHIKHQVCNTATTYTLNAKTRYIRIYRASADIVYKAGQTQASVEGANIPAAATDPKAKATDPWIDHMITHGFVYFRAE